MTPHDGLLAIDRGRYVDNDSMCCSKFTEKFLLRWNGRNYETASDRIVRNRIP